ncbi:MAG: hypothetical protein NZU63_08920 [Gemmataceae bacterium]|nr:hypothetical protein [Gemmataceae bacterium]MDW8244306.1 hypothetical protein [Thermogemmata sp.]
MHPLNDPVQLTLTELGEPEAIFRFSRGRFAALLLLGVGLLVGGIALNYYWWVQGPRRIGHLQMVILLLLPLSGVSLLYHLYRQRGLTVLVYPVGLVRIQRHHAVIFPWSEVTQVRLGIKAARKPVVERNEAGEITGCVIRPIIPLVRVWNVRLTLVRQDGVEADFTAVVARCDDLVAQVQRWTFAAQWPLLWQQLQQEGTVAFGPWKVSRQGVHTADETLTWANFLDLRLKIDKVFIQQRQRWLAWTSQPIENIPNLHLFWALVEELSRQAALAPSDSRSAHPSSLGYS